MSSKIRSVWPSIAASPALVPLAFSPSRWDGAQQGWVVSNPGTGRGMPLDHAARSISLMTGALLGHRCSLRHRFLPLDLFPSPSSGFDGAKLEVAVGSSFLDQLFNPLLPEITCIFSLGEGICQIPTPK